MTDEDDEDEYEEEEDDEDDAGSLPYYRQARPQAAMPRKGCLATAGEGCLHFVVTHIALYLCLATIFLGGGILVKGLIRLGWHGASIVILGGLMILVYVVVVIAVVAVVSRLGKRIMRDENF
jgi:hypothetical protein